MRNAYNREFMVPAAVRVHEYPDRHLAIFHGPRRLAEYDASGKECKIKTKGAA